MNELHKFDTINYEKTTDSHWCRLRRKDGMRVFFLHGVLDTSILTKGIEYVIDTIIYANNESKSQSVFYLAFAKR